MTHHWVLIILALAVGSCDYALFKPIQNISKVTVGKDTLSSFQILNDKPPKLKLDEQASYYWFGSKRLHVNVGDFSGRLVHGTIERKLADGTMIEKGQCDYGRPEGIWKQWHTNGRLLQSTVYRKGKLDGIQKQYDGFGKLLSVRSYEDGVLHGWVKTYRADTVYNSIAYNQGQQVLPKPPNKKPEKQSKSKDEGDTKKHSPSKVKESKNSRYDGNTKRSKESSTDSRDNVQFEDGNMDSHGSVDQSGDTH